jgi:hypothetical protein
MDPGDGGAVDVLKGMDDLVECFGGRCSFDDVDPDPSWVPYVGFVYYNISRLYEER